MTERQFRFSERLAAGYILRIVNPVANAGWDAAFVLFGRLSPRFARWLAEFMQMRLLPFLLLDFLAWPFALAFLQQAVRAAPPSGAGAMVGFIDHAGANPSPRSDSQSGGAL